MAAEASPGFLEVVARDGCVTILDCVDAETVAVAHTMTPTKARLVASELMRYADLAELDMPGFPST